MESTISSYQTPSMGFFFLNLINIDTRIIGDTELLLW